MTWLLRMVRLIRRPPSEARVKLVVGVVLACLAIVAIEHFIGWPDWMSAERMPVRR